MAPVLIASHDIQGIHKFMMAETEIVLLAEGIFTPLSLLCLLGGLAYF